MIFVKQSTAITLKLGPFIDETDGKTAETGLTISQADVRLSKNGGNMAQKNDATACTHDEIGFYDCPLDATDTNTLGVLRVMVHEAGALPVWIDCMVMPANLWDSLFGADKLQVDLVEWIGVAPLALSSQRVQTLVAAIAANAITATAINSNAITSAKIATDAIGAAQIAANAIGSAELADNAITAAKIATDALTAAKIAADAIGASELAADAAIEIAAAVWDKLMSAHVTVGTFGQRLQAQRTGTAQAGAAGTITLDASASAVDDFYNNSLVLITGGAGVGQVRTISDYVGSSKVASITPNWATTPDNTSVFVVIPMGEIAGASAPSAATVADAVWDEARADHVGAGSFGEGVKAESLNTQAKADVNAEADAALTDYDPPTTAELDAGLAALNDPTVAAIADGVWDELTVNHELVGSFGQRVRGLTSGTAQGGTASTITLAAGESGVNDKFKNAVIRTGDGTGGNQARRIIAYNGTTKVATVTPDWTTTPDATTEYVIEPGGASNVGAVLDDTAAATKLRQHALGVLRGVATSGGTTTALPLNTSTGIDGGVPSATDDFYNGRVVVFLTGSLAGQATDITDYNGSTKVLTITALTGAPASGDTFVIV